METQRKYGSHQAAGREGRHAGFHDVGPPMPCEGIGNALRATFRPGRNDLPDDMLDLLARLDQ